MNFIKNTPTAIYAIIFITMFLPFITVQCGGQDFATLTGTQLAAGTTIQQPGYGNRTHSKRVDSEPLATIAMVIVIIGFAVSLIKSKTGASLSLLSSILGTIILILLSVKLNGDASKEGKGAIQIKYLFGYWLTVILFIVNIFINGSLIGKYKSKNKEII